MTDFRTNSQLLEAIHIFYNESTNVMCSVQFQAAYDLYEVRRSDLDVIQLMSMDRILEKRGDDKWEFLGVL